MTQTVIAGPIKGCEPEHGHQVIRRKIPTNSTYFQQAYDLDPAHYRYQWVVVCSCGWEHQVQLTPSGSANRNLRAIWSGHVDAANNDGLIISMGTITKTRSEQRVQVMPTALALESGFNSTRRWNNYYIANAWAGVVTTDTKNTSKQRVLFSYAERESAISKCRDYLRRAAEVPTYKVTIEETGEQTISMQEETYRILNAADKALETGNLHDIEAAWQQFVTFDSLLPVINQKRDAIVSLRNSMLLKR